MQFILAAVLRDQPDRHQLIACPTARGVESSILVAAMASIVMKTSSIASASEHATYVVATSDSMANHGTVPQV